MLTEFFKSDSRITNLRNGCNGQLLDEFAGHLFESGYAQITARRLIRAVEHLMYWAGQKGLRAADLPEDSIQVFYRHLNRCRCVGFGRTYEGDLKNGPRLFWAHLQNRNVSIRSPIQSPPADPPLLIAFKQWMRQQRGTCDPTLYNYSLSIRELLNRVGETPETFDAKSLRNFVLEKSKQSGWAATKKCTTALRMFLRFLIAEGKCRIGLDASIPVVPHWRLSSLPQYLRAKDVERVTASCDRKTEIGKRDYAILLLLARLGLRAGDIVQMRLEDIDWEQAWICVSGKGRRQTRLPLTQELGKAISTYLKDGRPPTSSDRLFIRSRAPFREFASHAAVSVLVANAMCRAGVKPPRRGAAHVLRHSAATSMLQQGASLHEIAAILRHRSIETTQIYAKVDFPTLREIAQPWPEVQK